MGIKTSERMWYTADRDRLVPADDPAAAFQAPKEFTEEEARRLGVGDAGTRSVAADGGDGLERLTVLVLAERAKALGIETKDMKKADLVAAIRAAESPVDTTGDAENQPPSGDQQPSSPQDSE